MSEIGFGQPPFGGAHRTGVSANGSASRPSTLASTRLAKIITDMAKRLVRRRGGRERAALSSANAYVDMALGADNLSNLRDGGWRAAVYGNRPGVSKAYSSSRDYKISREKVEGVICPPHPGTFRAYSCLSLVKRDASY